MEEEKPIRDKLGVEIELHPTICPLQDFVFKKRLIYYILTDKMLRPTYYPWHEDKLYKIDQN